LSSYLISIFKKKDTVDFCLKSFSLLILLFAVFVPISLLLGEFYSSLFFQVFKGIFFLELLSLFMVFLFSFTRKSFDSFELFLIFFGLISLFNGIINNPVDRFFFSHMYGWLISFLGYFVGKNFSERISLVISNKLSDYLVKISFFVLFFFSLFYFTLYQTGKIAYFGISTMLPLFFFYFQSKKKVFLAIICFFTMFLTGKRVVILGTILVVIFFLLLKTINLLKSNMLSWKKMVLWMLAGLLLVTFFIYLVGENTTLLNRFKLFFSPDIFTEYGFYVATSGRSHEVKFLLRHLEENPLTWFVGGGWGDRFIESIDPTGYFGSWGKHYSHFSFFYFVLVYGLFFAFFAFKKFFYALKLIIEQKKDNFESKMYAYLFISSFSGSIMFVDPLFWFFLGSIYSYECTKKNI